jgi:DNA-binding protein Fis
MHSALSDSQHFVDTSALLGLINALQETQQPLEITCVIRLEVILEAINNGATLSQIVQNIIRNLEKYMIDYILKSTNGNKLYTAKLLNINRKTLYRKLKKYSL